MKFKETIDISKPSANGYFYTADCFSTIKIPIPIEVIKDGYLEPIRIIGSVDSFNIDSNLITITGEINNNYYMEDANCSLFGIGKINNNTVSNYRLTYFNYLARSTMKTTFEVME